VRPVLAGIARDARPQTEREAQRFSSACRIRSLYNCNHDANRNRFNMSAQVRAEFIRGVAASHASSDFCDMSKEMSTFLKA